MYEEQELTKLINESLKKPRPGVIALAGPWGCGKSYLLNKVLNAFNHENEFALIAVHNAWEDDFSGKPIVPALFKLAQKLDTTVYPPTEEQVEEKCVKRRGRVVKIAASLIRCIPGCGEVPAGIAGLLGTVIGSRDGEPKDDEVLQSNPMFSNVRGWSDVYTEFGRICDEPSLSIYKKILVIDDLDRVLPTRQMDLLESLHHLAERIGILIIVAYDPDQLEQTIKTYYGNDVNVERYIEKIFNAKVICRDNEYSSTAERIVSIIQPRISYMEKGFWNRLTYLLALVKPTKRNQIKLIQAIEHYANSLNSNECLGFHDWISIIIRCLADYCGGIDGKGWLNIEEKYVKNFSENPFNVALDRGVNDVTSLFYPLRLCIFDSLDAKIEIPDKNVSRKDGEIEETKRT